MPVKSSKALTALTSLAALGAVVVLGHPVQAHNVETNYILSSQNELEIQVMYSTGEPFESAPVKIYSPTDSETPVLEGMTDEDGRFAFEADTDADPGDWKMRIGELGHADILLVPVDENGIDIEQVSSSISTPDQSNGYWTAGLAILSLGLAAKVARSRM